MQEIKCSAADPVSLDVFKERLEKCEDVIVTNIPFGKGVLTMFTVDGLISTEVLDENVLRPLSNEEGFIKAKSEKDAIGYIMRGNIYHVQVELIDNLTDAMQELLFGSAILVFEKEQVAVRFDVKGFEVRSVSSPTNETVLKGGKDGLVESIRRNTALLRLRIQTNDLKIEHFKIGRRTHTPICIMYMSGIANHDAIENVKQKLNAADIDGFVSAGQLEAIMYDNLRTIFPQMLYTERADKCAGNLLEGRIAILVDGLPISFITPVDFNSFMQASEDYSSHFIASSLFRATRYFCMMVSLLLPALYIAFTEFHQEIIPVELANAIIASKRGVPFPTSIEVIMMLVALEVLLEAGARLPQSVGQTVGIVGALIIGQAAITAHILSPGVVITIATAGVTSFVIPSQDMSVSIRLFRFGLVICAMGCGLIGVAVGIIILFYNLCSIEVLGTPYLSPFTGAEWRRLLTDTLVRMSWVNKTARPQNIGVVNDKRAQITNTKGEDASDEN